MRRQNLDAGGWFDLDRATRYEEARRWNGNNHISRATGSQFEHERLYRTARNTWVLYSWSQWQGSTETWRTIAPDEAHAWLLRNEHFDAVPGNALEAAEV